MPSIIRFEPLSGAKDEGPLCYMLQVDEFKFLLDCGWDESFSMSYIESLKPYVHEIDAVLLSYPDTYHLGALPYLVGKCGLDCPIFATIPVHKMGQMFMYDLYQARVMVEDFDVFDLNDVDAAFEKMTTVKYSQTINLTGKGRGLQIVALYAGHMVGGTVWKIVKEGEEEIVYMVDINHKKDRHLNGCHFESIVRPHILITDCYNANYIQPRRKQRDELLMTEIHHTLRGGGNVLIATDTAGRVLELAHMMDHVWHQPESGLLAYSLVMMSNLSYNVIEFAKSMVEWMSDQTLRGFEGQRVNPFVFRHVILCHTMAEFKKIPDPKVVLASMADLECGFARTLFTSWVSDSRNTVILTTRTSPSTLARRLIDDNPSLERMMLEVKRRVRLEGEELDDYMRKQREKQIEEENIKKEEESGSEEESDDELASAALAVPAGVASGQPSGSMVFERTMGTNNYSSVPLGGSLSDNKFGAKGHSRLLKHLQRYAHPTYPLVEKKIKWDDYGEIINPADYLLGDVLLPRYDHMASSEVVPSEDLDRTMSPGGTGAGGLATPTIGGGAYGEPMVTGDGNDGVMMPPPSSASYQPPAPPGIDPDTALATMPTKPVSTMQMFDVRANILFIDFEGRSDGESIKKIIQQIKPTKLVLVHGNEESTRLMTEFCQSTMAPRTAVSAPRCFERLDLSSDRHMYQVRLTDQLASGLRFFKAGDFEVAWVDGIINAGALSTALVARNNNGDQQVATTANGDGANNNNDQMSTAPGSRAAPMDAITLHESTPLLDVLPQDEVPYHDSLFVSEPRLSDLKQVLQRENVKAEFNGGILVCDDVIAIKRTEAGRFQLEGPLCEAYFRVRDVLYQQFAIL